MDEHQRNNSASNFSDLYKVSTIQFDQNKRRQHLLDIQKKLRNNVLDEFRGIENLVKSETETVPEPEQTIRKHKKFKNNKYKNTIMFSEWLTEIPLDFQINWFMKICPVGHRNLVVADLAKTRSYSKTGKFEYQFKSVLPGGSFQNPSKSTILDCVWNEQTQTFYILDVLVWADVDLTNTETELRFFWLNSKMTELEDLGMNSSNNTYKFKYVQHFIANPEIVTDCLNKYPFYETDSPEVDGLLFYHKLALYSAGATPLVGWLKPYMVPEILKLPVAAKYLTMKPKRYVNLVEHLKYKEQKTSQNKMVEVEMDEDVEENLNSMNI